MKHLVSILLTIGVLITSSSNGLTSSVQKPRPTQDPFAAPSKDFMRNLHPKAVIGSTPERKAAWDRLTPAQQAKVTERFRSIAEAAKEKATKEKRGHKSAPVDITLSFVGKKGKRQFAKAKAHEPVDSNVDSLRCADCDPCFECEPDPCFSNPSLCENPTPTPTPYPTPTPEPTPTPFPTPTPGWTPNGTDADIDGLSDSFENELADAFTPFYHVSAGEPDGFATFGNFVPQTVQQVFPPIPPISHFRVKPLGFSNDAYGNQYGLVQLDYLTLWNHDSGLDVGGWCTANLSIALGLAGYGTSLVLDGLGAHPLDNERSAILVAAPVSGYNTFNTNPWAYSAYEIFTAAHEDTFTDQSIPAVLPQPVPAGNHVELALSRSKHATYPFNPDYYPLVPGYVIYSTYATIEFLYYNYYISNYEYWAYLYAADSAYYSCIVDRFQDQGGTYAGMRINVGELSNPINGSNFIQSTELTKKLNKTFY